MTPSASSQQDTAHPLLSNAENSPQDEDRLLTEDDEYIEEGEEIFLPGMAFTSSVGERSDIRETKPAETVEEGGYSDDDLFAGTLYIGLSLGVNHSNVKQIPKCAHSE